MTAVFGVHLNKHPSEVQKLICQFSTLNWHKVVVDMRRMVEGFLGVNRNSGSPEACIARTM